MIEVFAVILMILENVLDYFVDPALALESKGFGETQRIVENCFFKAFPTPTIKFCLFEPIFQNNKKKTETICGIERSSKLSDNTIEKTKFDREALVLIDSSRSNNFKLTIQKAKN
ncbi:hypothetical protein BpHYR1_003182 [Brachionus plicatilis]|uniref:Uncharacterized protein n=1 Tax=Brachionus plicatilis TaxID=10195 RepID=A0A3M7RNX3_BRAPC|nr:hypothetical protein BpHYR1_003182 [Brachionus plicatilis]